MWRRFGQLGGFVLAFSLGMSASGCGQISGAPPSLAEGGAGGLDGDLLSAGNGAEATAGTSQRGGSQSGGSQSGGATGSPSEGGAPSGGLGGPDTVAGAGGGPTDDGTRAGEGCSLVHHVEVPFPVQTNPFVVKSGVEFAVSNGLTLATASWSGELARQSFGRDTCPGCDGRFGLTALRAAAGWRLLSIDGAEGGGAASRAWRMNDESRPDALPLFGPYFSGLVSSFALGHSRDGTRAVFANGHQVISKEMTFALLDADGRMVAPPSTLQIPSSYWDNLTVVSTEHAAAISLITDSDDREQRIWLLRELSSSGQVTFASQVTLPAGYGGVSDGYGSDVVWEDADGYYLGLRNAAGPLRVGRLRRDHPNDLVVDERLLPPGIPVGTLKGMLVFLEQRSTATTKQSRFVGLPESGAGEARTLATTPVFESYPDPRVQLIALEGNSLFYAYETGDSQVIEEVACPTE